MEFTTVLKNISSFFPESKVSKKKPQRLKVFLISPHPDDECITSSLALRLAQENGCKVVNIAVTLGSLESRKKERKKELLNACKTLQFKNYILSEDWKLKSKELIQLIKKYKPEIIIAPHNLDIHPTHIKTSNLLRESLVKIKNQTSIVAWSEYWGQLKKPNLMLEVPNRILELQMLALACHTGEVLRNPYHLRLPGWMMDNVRRGSELTTKSGAFAPKIPFAILYQIQLYQKGKFLNLDSFPFISGSQDLGQIFKLILDEASESKNKKKLS